MYNILLNIRTKTKHLIIFVINFDLLGLYNLEYTIPKMLTPLTQKNVKKKSEICLAKSLVVVDSAARFLFSSEF